MQGESCWNSILEGVSQNKRSRCSENLQNSGERTRFPDARIFIDYEFVGYAGFATRELRFEAGELRTDPLPGTLCRGTLKCCGYFERKVLHFAGNSRVSRAGQGFGNETGTIRWYFIDRRGAAAEGELSFFINFDVRAQVLRIELASYNESIAELHNVSNEIEF